MGKLSLGHKYWPSSPEMNNLLRQASQLEPGGSTDGVTLKRGFLKLKNVGESLKVALKNGPLATGEYGNCYVSVQNEGEDFQVVSIIMLHRPEVAPNSKGLFSPTPIKEVSENVQ